MDQQSDRNIGSSPQNEENQTSADLSIQKETISNASSRVLADIDVSAARRSPPVGCTDSSTASSGHAVEGAAEQQLSESSYAVPPLAPSAAHPFHIHNSGTARQRIHSDQRSIKSEPSPTELLSDSLDPDIPDNSTASSISTARDALRAAQHKRSISAPIPAAALVQSVPQQPHPNLLVATPSIINSVQPRQAIQPAPIQPNFQNDHDISEQSPQGRYVRFVEKLGSGAYKDVYRAYDTIEGIEVAWNQVNLSGLPKADKARIINEVRLLERLHHANIISFHGSWVNREKEQVIFVTEILSSGTLKSFINKVKVIRWKIAKRWAIQILKGLEYLHSQDPPIIHRDLKCDNIFINGATGDLRIGDLGLSTVISRKTKVLSVLGTPEFMAPELYDESYDEKVDIYAFGMCLLEIFTKEVPYRECRNPAQIYKKVTNHIAPASLARVKSKEAQDFILLCLGTPNEQGEYCRPSAAELLRHSFLEKCPDDESEVEVISPVPETVIEGSGDGTTTSLEDLESSMGSFRPSSGEVTGVLKGVSIEAQHRVSATSSIIPQPSASESSEDDGNLDHLSSMPNSEENMRKVKVLMGRGQEIEDEVVVPPKVVEMTADSETKAARDQPSNVAKEHPTSLVVAPSATATQFYPVAAYGTGEIEKDVMKLNITLPYEGKTSNVQFDFHLIQDDPVQVTREMVTELGIPESAVLQISEAISGLARDARIRQKKEKEAKKQQQVTKPTAAVTPSTHSIQPPQAPQPQQAHLARNHTPPTEGFQPQQTSSCSPAIPPKQPQVTQAHLVRNQTPPLLEGAVHSSSSPPIVVPTHGSLVQNAHQQQSHHQSPVLVANGMASAQHVSPVPPHVLDSVTLPSLNFFSQPISSSSSAAVSLNDTTPLRSVKSVGAAPSSLAGISLRRTSSDDESSSVSAEENLEELRRIEEEYQKCLQRAKKVYDSRMENLQRSLIEREAQHQQNLMKHEKERAEFEKKVKLAEAEQAKRLQELEEKCRQQKAELVKNKPKSNGMQRSVTSNELLSTEVEDLDLKAKMSISCSDLTDIVR